jgi:hypothetical protein
MRLFKLFSLLSLFFGARAFSLKSREPAPHPLDVRDLLDVCASINIDLAVPDLLGILTAVGVIGRSTSHCIASALFLIECLTDVCLCLSALPLFLETNVVAIAAVNIAGGQVVHDALTDLVCELTCIMLWRLPDLIQPQIHSNAPNSNCNYPEDSTPACIDNDPCGFQCNNGFTPSPAENPTTCACQAPSVLCNGQCVDAGSCPSSVPPPRKRWLGSGTCAEMGPEWAACGVFGGGARAWECINTARDLESCKYPSGNMVVLCLRMQLILFSLLCRWWMHAASDSLYTVWPGLY